MKVEYCLLAFHHCAHFKYILRKVQLKLACAFTSFSSSILQYRKRYIVTRPSSGDLSLAQWFPRHHKVSQIQRIHSNTNKIPNHTSPNHSKRTPTNRSISQIQLHNPTNKPSIRHTKLLILHQCKRLPLLIIHSTLCSIPKKLPSLIRFRYGIEVGSRYGFDNHLAKNLDLRAVQIFF